MEKICKHCGGAYVVSRYREGTARFCSLRCFQAFRSQNGFEPYQRAPKPCKYCGASFIPKTGRAVFCYGEGCRSRGRTAWRDRAYLKRTAERRQVQEYWGYANSRHLGHKGGTRAEEAASLFLKERSFENIVSATTDGANFPWDIIADRAGLKYVIQVTMRTHARHKYAKAAQALGVRWAVLFVKPDLTRAILKVPGGNHTELRLKEVIPNESGDMLNYDL